MLAKSIIAGAVDASTRGILRSRMAVGWTYTQSRLIETAIRKRLKKLGLDERILSPVAGEPFRIYTSADVQGQERDETWVSFGHGIDPRTGNIATVRQPTIDASTNFLQKMNVLTTRSRIATHFYHSISPLELIHVGPSTEVLALLALFNIENIAFHARYQIEPDYEANSYAYRYLRDANSFRNPLKVALVNPLAIDLGCVIGVKDESDPPDCWRAGLFRKRKHWHEVEAATLRAMLTAKGWLLINF